MQQQPSFLLGTSFFFSFYDAIKVAPICSKTLRMPFAAIRTVVARLNADSVGLVPPFLAPPHGSLLVLALRVLKRICFTICLKVATSTVGT